MNGMSLAALLGAATWFGHKAEPKLRPEDEPAAEPVTPAEDTSDPGDFLWAPNPLFQ